MRKTIRFSDDEWTKISAELEKLNVDFSTFARAKILENKIKVASKVDPQLLFELNKIGNNLNQIARLANRKKRVDISVLEQLVKIEEMIKNAG